MRGGLLFLCGVGGALFGVLFVTGSTAWAGFAGMAAIAVLIQPCMAMDDVGGDDR